jgi:hypothetical protein
MGSESIDREYRPRKQLKSSTEQMRELEEDRARYSIFLPNSRHASSGERNGRTSQSGQEQEIISTPLSRHGFKFGDVLAYSPEELNSQTPNAETSSVRLTDRFEREAANTAQGILQSNRDRLDTQQQQYIQDQNPNSPHWRQLWQIAERHQALQQSQSRLTEQLNALNTEKVEAYAPPDLYDPRPGESPEARQHRIKSHPFQQRQEEIQQQTKTLQSQIDSLEQTRVSLEFIYPGVRAVRSETGKDPKDVQSVLGRMSKEFKGIRSNIDQLSKELQENPSTVKTLDTVVAAQLERWRKDPTIPPDQTKQVEQWLKTEKENKRRSEQVTGGLGALLGIGSLFVPGGWVPKSIVSLMRVGGAGLSLYSAASSLPDLMVLNKATQAQRAGGGELTPQSEGEAQFNLVMGYSNLVLAGVDAGAPQLVQRVVRYTGSEGIQLFSKLDRTTLQKVLRGAQSRATGQSPEWIEAMQSLKKAAGSDENLYRRLVNALNRAGNDKLPPSGGAPELATEGGPRQVSRTEVEPSQPLRSQGSSSGSGWTRPPKADVARITKLKEADIDLLDQMEGGKDLVDKLVKLENSQKLENFRKEALVALEQHRQGKTIESLGKEIPRPGKNSHQAETEIDVETTDEIIQIKAGDYSTAKKLSGNDMDQFTNTKRYRDKRASNKHKFYDSSGNELPTLDKKVVFHFANPISDDLKNWLIKKGAVVRVGIP